MEGSQGSLWEGREQHSEIKDLHGALHGKGDCRELPVESGLKSTPRARCSTYHLWGTLVGVDRDGDEVMDGVGPF